eukprot:799115-Prymnesium_polylepis.1
MRRSPLYTRSGLEDASWKPTRPVTPWKRTLVMSVVRSSLPTIDERFCTSTRSCSACKIAKVASYPKLSSEPSSP